MKLARINKNFKMLRTRTTGPILSDNSNVGSIYVLLSKWIFERPGETKSSDVNVSTVDP